MDEGMLDCASEFKVQEGILFPWFVELLGCATLFLLTQFNIPVPFAAAMFMLGTIMAAGISFWNNSDSLSNSIIMWSCIDSELLLLIFLPGLIFKEAVEINLNLFLVALPQILMLAFPMVMLGTFLTALVALYILPYGFNIGAAASLGAILASTDPIAVASVLKTAGASPRLVMHIAGESLLNDGSAYVFFTIFSQIYYNELGLPDSEKVTVGEGFVTFFQMALGGLAMGLVFGVGLLVVLRELDRRLDREFDILQVVAGISTAYLCFYVCDQHLGMSGVVACVACGIMVNAFGRGMINDEEAFGSHLALLEWLLNTFLFTLGGVIWGHVSFENTLSYRVEGQTWGWLFLLYILVLVIRFIQVLVIYPVFSRVGLKSDYREAIFLSYGGLRGAVGVALGLALFTRVVNLDPDPFSEARTNTTVLQFLGGGVTLLTLTINGTSAGFILRKLGLSKPAASKERTKILFEGSAKDFVNEQAQMLLQDSRFESVNYLVLVRNVPFLSSTPPHVTDESAVPSPQPTRHFHEQVVDNGSQYLRVVGVTAMRTDTGLNDSGFSSDTLRNDMLIEFRTIFLELLREAYKVQLELGELDENEGNTFDVLIDSVDLALNDVQYHAKQIEDWKHTHSFQFNLRRSRILGVSHLEHFPRSVRSVNSSASHARRFINQHAQADALLVLAFKEGHAMAEAKLRRYVNRVDDVADETVRETIRLAMEHVLKESDSQVVEANRQLNEEICYADLEIILSHQCARILLHRLIKFTERKAEDGLLSKKEARAYLKDFRKRIDHDLKKSVATCLAEENLSDEEEESKNVAALVEEEEPNDGVDEEEESITEECKVEES